MIQFEQKVVWITGASSGIGEALAYAFAKQKSRLVLSARRADELERVKEGCGLPEGHVLLLPLDVSEHHKAEEAHRKVVEHFGQVDILINNAGLSHWSKIRDLSLEVIKKIMDVNFLGGVALTKAVLPHMLERKQGRVVVISSILGKIVTPKQAAYNASKHAIQGFYDTLRAEVRPEGLKVLVVNPGFVNTNVAKNSLDKEGKPINRSNKMIEKGLSPHFVAEEVIKALRKDKEEIILAGGKEKFAILMKRFTPGLFSKFLSGRKAS